MTDLPDPSLRGDYEFRSAAHSGSHSYLLPVIVDELKRQGEHLRVFDLGCGNGSIANHLSTLGHDLTGVDPSSRGIAEANKAYPGIRLEEGSAYDALAAKYGQFDVVISLEVVEHVYAPRIYAKTLHDLVRPGGLAVISTPYHGYLKNLALAMTGKMDSHFTALWDHGHIKFWSMKTLTALLEETGLKVERFHRVGRVPALAKSMVAVVRRPG